MEIDIPINLTCVFKIILLKNNVFKLIHTINNVLSTENAELSFNIKIGSNIWLHFRMHVHRCSNILTITLYQ